MGPKAQKDYTKKNLGQLHLVEFARNSKDMQVGNLS